MKTKKTLIRPNTGDGLPKNTQCHEYRCERGAIVDVETIFATAHDSKAHDSNGLKPVSAKFSWGSGNEAANP
ncbi:hypothetical protein N9189_00405 [Pirellulaceae bacterium]|nr:hypothetical protein [Pirellulaceae bacterium]